MTRCVIVLPSIVPAYTKACLESIHGDIIRPDDFTIVPPTRQRGPVIQVANGRVWTDGRPDVRLVVVWNTPEHNLGCAGSWNVGRDEVLRTEADWLIVLSAATRFGKEGGRDFLAALDAETRWENYEALVMEADGGVSWHCIAFSRRVLEVVGPFDPIFWPAYFEDNDWSVRFQRAYDCDTHAPSWVGPLWPKVPVDATLVEVAHGIKRSGVKVNMAGLRKQMHAKWGKDEEYATPYNDPALDWTYTGSYPPIDGTFAVVWADDSALLGHTYTGSGPA